MPTQIQMRRGTAAEWTAANPILANAEIGYEKDTRKFKFGDGVTAWNSLAYSAASTLAATNVTYTPGGTVAATDVQAAIAEVASEAGAAVTALSAADAAHAGAADPHVGYLLKSLFDEAGDLIVGTADNVASRLGIGAPAQVLTVSGSGNSLEWTTIATGSGFADWTSLGNLGATETITASPTQISRFYGTLDAATAITVSVAANRSVELKLTQDATGGRNPSWVGVNVWTTLSGQAPNLANRGVGVDDWFSFENIGGTVYGSWLTEASKGVVTLTDGANIATDTSRGNVFIVTLGGNRTMDNPTNPVAGQQLLYRIIQDATGSRTVTWGSKFRFSSGLPQPTLSTAANKIDYVGFIYNLASDRWDCLAYNLGF